MVIVVRCWGMCSVVFSTSRLTDQTLVFLYPSIFDSGESSLTQRCGLSLV